MVIFGFTLVQSNFGTNFTFYKLYSLKILDIVGQIRFWKNRLFETPPTHIDADLIYYCTKNQGRGLCVGDANLSKIAHVFFVHTTYTLDFWYSNRYGQHLLSYQKSGRWVVCRRSFKLLTAHPDLLARRSSHPSWEPPGTHPPRPTRRFLPRPLFEGEDENRNEK